MNPAPSNILLLPVLKIVRYEGILIKYRRNKKEGAG